MMAGGYESYLWMIVTFYYWLKCRLIFVFLVQIDKDFRLIVLDLHHDIAA